jgi:hypothetical protein
LVSNAAYDGSAIVAQCCEAARARFGAQLPPLLSSLAERLGKEGGDREEREQYGAAAQRLRNEQGAFLEAFQRELVTRIETATEALKSGRLRSGDDEDLSTLKTNLLENQVAVNKLAVQLKQAAGDELAKLTGRIAAVFGRRTLDDGDNPLGPMTIAFAVYAGVAALELPTRAARAMRPDLEKLLVAPVCDLYRVMNGALERAGIAPTSAARAQPAATGGPPSAAAQAAAAKTVAAMLGVTTVPAPVASFLTETWSQVLARAHAQGTDSAPWREAVDVMNELIASVKPGIDPDERARLKSVLPGLLKQLQAGMNAIALDPAKRQTVLDVLMVHHRDILVGPRSAHA